MARPATIPIGLQVGRTAKVLRRAFEAAMARAGGSEATWLVLLALKGGGHRTQGEIAEAVGVQGPTLSHHLDRLARDGLITRERDPANRRVMRVDLTDAGEALFVRLRDVALAFDARLREGLEEDELEAARAVLAHLEANAP